MNCHRLIEDREVDAGKMGCIDEIDRCTIIEGVGTQIILSRVACVYM